MQHYFINFFLARAAMLTGRLPIRNGFYTSTYHGHNGKELLQLKIIKFFLILS